MQAAGALATIGLGLALAGAAPPAALILRADLAQVPAEARARTLARTAAILRARLASLGCGDIGCAGGDRIVIELPDEAAAEADAIAAVAVRPGTLEFRIVAEDGLDGVDLEVERARLELHLAAQPERGRDADLAELDVRGTDGVLYRWAAWSEAASPPAGDGAGAPPFELLAFAPGATFGNADFEAVFPTIDARGFHALGFTLRSDRRGAFGAFTEANVGQRLAIVLDGRIHSTPTLNSRIEANGIIEGGNDGFTARELQDLRSVLLAEPLPVRLERVER